MSGHSVHIGGVTANELSVIMRTARAAIRPQIKQTLAKEGLRTVDEIERSTPAVAGLMNARNRAEVKDEGSKIVLRFTNNHEYFMTEQDDVWFNKTFELSKHILIPFLRSLERTYEAVLEVAMDNLSGGE